MKYMVKTRGLMHGVCSIERLESRQLLTTNLIADFGGIYPVDTLNVDGTSFFVARDSAHGRELWRSDGTQAGTRMVRDVTPGWQSSNILQMTPFKNGVAFFVRGEDQKLALWVSDGTRDGTTKVADMPADLIVNTFNATDNKLIYITGDASDADNPLQGGKLWASDGTPAGTGVILDLPSYDYVVNLREYGTHRVGNRIVFATHFCMFSTDGTVEGTQKLADGYDPVFENQVWIDSNQQVIDDGDVIYFTMSTHGPFDLWATDGTNGGLKHLAHNVYASNKPVVIDHVAYFAFQNNTHFALWRSDGTVGGTYEAAHLPNVFIGDQGAAVGLGKKLIFYDRYTPFFHPDSDRTDTPMLLWSFDPGTGAFELLKEFDAGTYMDGGLIVCGNTVFFRIWDTNDSKHHELWRTDGTTATTKLFASTPYTLAVSSVYGKLAIMRDGKTTLIDPAAGDAATEPAMGKCSLKDGILHVYGTRDSDSIRMYDVDGNPSRFNVVLNGVRRSFAYNDVSRILVYGYSGDDNIAVNEKRGAFTARCRVWGGDGSDFIYTGRARDTILGEGGADSIFGGNNDDKISGGMGSDSIQGGNGNDIIDGDEDADRINGNAGVDTLAGGSDDSPDTLDGGEGTDVLFGQDVYDTFYNANGDGGTIADEVLQV